MCSTFSTLISLGLLDEHQVAEVRRCFDCGVKEVRVAVRHGFESAHGSAVELDITLPVWVCGACGFEYIDGRAAIAVDGARQRFLRRRLLPHEVRSIRKKRGWSRRELAELTGFGEASIKRWETGKLVQNASADRLLRLIDREPAAVSTLQLLELQIRSAAEA